MSEAGIKKAAGMLDESERKARSGGIDLTHIEGKKPDRHYAFILSNRTDMLKAKLDGYSAVLKSENPDMDVPAGEVNAEGNFELGDTILMEIPLDVKNAMTAEDASRQDLVLKKIKSEFHEEGRNLGVKTFEEGDDAIHESMERQKATVTGRKTFAMGVGIDKTTGTVTK